MTTNRKLAAFVLAAGVGAMNLVTLAASAQADEYRGHGDRSRGTNYSRPAPRFAGRDEHRDHRGAGRAIGAITLGALMAAAIIASEGSRHRDRDYDRD